ncbi:PIN domain-containing protein [Candidatus Magnetomonas plexicatena]|uniref:PIN domain-containing protein n=1 Tax=Candidatus Magnetomonas plexicatena TaxID=2552947 RepID=UPI001100E917|nr:type II toxin-antitoxin system VapC family toxin [Nitrospirales bacterium LBB_01]
MILPDTNTIVRYILKDVSNLYVEAEKLFEKVRTGKENIVVLESVLVECVYVLVKFYKVPRSETSYVLQGFLSYKGVKNVDKDELIESLRMYSASNLDIVDCILCTKSECYKMPLFSFDNDLKNCITKMNQ